MSETQTNKHPREDVSTPKEQELKKLKVHDKFLLELETQQRERCRKHKQEHLFQFYDDLTEAQKLDLLRQIRDIDLDSSIQIFHKSVAAAKDTVQLEITPPQITGFASLNDLSAAIREEGKEGNIHPQVSSWWSLGLQHIAKSEVAVILLAGGQGTRLGSSDPKGMYDPGLPSHKSIFQLQAERILRLQQLAGNECVLPFYIMTSEFTYAPTVSFFEKNNYFGLKKDHVKFFNQGSCPCFTFDGKIILENSSKIACGPNGNGGIYLALEEAGILEHMKTMGVKYTHVYSVDNILVNVADPVFTGYCISTNAQVGAKVVPKDYPEEKVGVFATKNGKLCVVEYSELPPHLATKEDDTTKKLMFNAGNIAIHFYTTEFLQELATTMKNFREYHVAEKQIKCADESGNTHQPKQNNGIKLEMFIFDAFQFADRVVLLEVCRNEEFAPIKNAPGSAKDSPDTARALLSQLHRRYIENAGGKIEDNSDDKLNLCEISPLISYHGEGLEEIVKGKTFSLPLNLEKPHTLN